MSTVAEGHEGEETPSIVNGRVRAVLGAKPGLDFWSPGVVEANYRDQRRKARWLAAAAAAAMNRRLGLVYAARGASAVVGTHPRRRVFPD